MKFGKKLERLLLAEMGVCLIVLLLSVSDRCSSMAILLSTLFQIFMIIYIIVVLVHPLRHSDLSGPVLTVCQTT